MKKKDPFSFDHIMILFEIGIIIAIKIHHVTGSDLL